MLRTCNLQFFCGDVVKLAVYGVAGSILSGNPYNHNLHCCNDHLTKRHWYDQKNRILAGQAILYPFYMYTVELPTLLQYTAVLYTAVLTESVHLRFSR